MGYYSTNLIINNNTDDKEIKQDREQGLIAALRFSVNFNKKKLYLNNTILNQILESGAVQSYIVKECTHHFKENEEYINTRMKKIFTIEHSVKIDIKIIGKFFYIKFYCGRNHCIDECITALTKKLKKEKGHMEILRGE